MKRHWKTMIVQQKQWCFGINPLFNQSEIEIDGLHLAMMWAFEDYGGSKSI